MMNVRDGDLDKLGLLYERHKKRLFGFFYNLGNNPSVSEDLVQNVFIRVLKYRKSYTGEGSFAGGSRFIEICDLNLSWSLYVAHHSGH